MNRRLPFPDRDTLCQSLAICLIFVRLATGATLAHAQQSRPPSEQAQPDPKTAEANAEELRRIDDQIRSLEERKAALLAGRKTEQSGAQAGLVPQENSPLPVRPSSAAAPDPTGKPGSAGPKNLEPGRYQVNGQLTWILQSLFKYRSPYQNDTSGQGGGSLLSRNEQEMSQTYTLFLGARINRNLEVYINPEMARGHGISNALGVAGYTNGEVIRNPTLSQDPYLARYYGKWIIATGKGEEKVESGQNQVNSSRPTRRLVISAGKLGATDVFDLNSYANNTRTQFMNWALLNNGAYDYAADTRGYTRGIAVEWINPDFALRLGSFQMPTVANGIDLAGNVSRNRGDQIEVELHPRALPGKAPAIVRLLGYRNLARMGNYREAIALGQRTGTTPDITKTARVGAVKFGFGVNVEQPLGDDGATGLFGRYGWDDGATESFAFTEIDRALSLGAQVSGRRWRRPLDRFAIAFVQSDLASAHKDYLAAGGSGFLLGDGRLNYGPERILEACYTYQFSKSIGFSVDYQYINNPGYNRDRGPASVLSGRLHLEF